MKCLRGFNLEKSARSTRSSREERSVSSLRAQGRISFHPAPTPGLPLVHHAVNMHGFSALKLQDDLVSQLMRARKNPTRHRKVPNDHRKRFFESRRSQNNYSNTKLDCKVTVCLYGTVCWENETKLGNQAFNTSASDIQTFVAICNKPF